MAASDVKPVPAKLHYGWAIFALTFVALMCTAGMRSGPQVLLVPLEDQFGFSRTSLSFAIAAQLFVYGLIGPFSAGFINSFGVRATLVGALALIAAGLGATIFATQTWQLDVAWGLATGIGTGCAASVMAATIANRWFYAQRGLVLGFLTGTTAAGQLVFIPFIAQLVKHFGLNIAVATVCIVSLAMIPLVLLVMRNFPADKGLKPYGQPDDVPVPPQPKRANPFTATIATLGRVIVTREFWLLAVAYLFCGATTSGLIGTHFIPTCVDHGMVVTTAAGILAAMGVLNFFGTGLAGWLTDRFDSRMLLFWFYLSRTAALVFLPYAFELPAWGLVIFGLFYGLDWLATAPPTLRLTADAFGTASAGTVYGWLMVIHQVGASLAAFGVGYFRDRVGSYDVAYFISAVICAFAALAILQFGRGKKPDPRPVLAEAKG